ncbi:MAG: glycosyltransferase family 4 protein [Phycisphaerae bacterium]|nr:glycosyltransferase family 4 protein [Phycisphaerae bacterium]MDW8262167.1 glycosyltransferase family 4 protein [Phycisphaerales bacterium]
MKIGLIILHADARRGGAEKYTLDLARSLAHRGHDVTLLASSFHEPPWEVKQILCDARALTRAWRYGRFLSQLDMHLQSHSFDVLHAMLPVNRCDLYHPHAGLAAEVLATGHLMHRTRLMQSAARLANRFNARRQMFAAVERRMLSAPLPPMILCLSEYVRRTVRGRYAMDEQLLPVLFNGVDVRHFDPRRDPEAGAGVRARLQLSHDNIVGLIIAQDFHRKGLDTAIKALARVPDPRLKLLVVGRDRAVPFQKLASRLGAEKRVIFAGPAGDPYAYYRAADFFVLPTRHDPCSLVVLEALAMGVPTITSSANGAAEVITHGLDGLIVPDPNDVPRLTEAMKAMLDERRRDTMSQAALMLRPKLSYDEHIKSLLELYQRAITRKRRPTSRV